MDLVQVAVTSLVSLAAMFLLTKLMGNKQVSQMNLFDYVIGITVGSIAAEMATELDTPENSLVAMVVYAVAAVCISLWTNKSLRARRIITGKPLILMDGAGRKCQPIAMKPDFPEALLADAVATTAGAVLGTSTTTTFVESSSGVAAGARTGLSSVVTGFLFLISVVLSPIFCSIPSFATAPALIFVGFLMVSTVTSIEFTDMTEAIPAYLCLLAMPLMYSISEGIAIGIISWTIINVITGKAKEKKISPLMYVLTVLFILKYVFL